MLSFCNCKPPIRGSLHAVEGTYMVGCSKAEHGNTLLYFWKIAKVMSRETYLSQFPNRHDSIYRIDKNGDWRGTGFSPLLGGAHKWMILELSSPILVAAVTSTLPQVARDS